MAIFIPEWTRISGRNLQIKRVLNTLEDTCIVRRPIHKSTGVPELFIQHPTNGWLALAVSDLPFAMLDPGQLFETEGKAAFEQFMTEFRAIDDGFGRTENPLEKLLLMWSCSSEETRRLSSHYLPRFGIRLLSKEQFALIGNKLIPRLLAPLSEEGTESLLGHFFPEAEIPSVCTTRRSFHRDNSAKLTRFFLDSQQEWASKLDLETPLEQADTARDFSVRLVNGVAGSGKTLIALNRARLLADLFPQQKILVLIHNTPIVADIKHRLHKAYGSIPGNLEIATFYSWAAQQWQRLFHRWPQMPKSPKQVQELIEHYRSRWPELKVTDAQLLEELDFINATLISSENHYLDANRTGQGFSLRSKERSQVWAIYRAVTAALAQENLLLWSALPRDICLAEQLDALEKYHHILVDEAQFFAPSWFQVVKLSSAPDAQLFLCADPNQGFMKNRLSWKSIGLDVIGRTKKLRKSYRTTQAILRAASHLLTLSTQGDPEDYLEPDFVGMDPGTPPLLIYSASPQDAVDQVANDVAKIANQGTVPLSQVLVLYGDKINKTLLVQEIGKQIGHEKIWWLNKTEHKKQPPNGHEQDYLRVANVDSATGLEANIVILIGIENLLADADLSGIAADERAPQKEENARKLYMAMTRAGQCLILVASQRVAVEVENVFQRPS